jgi:carboxylesterase
MENTEHSALEPCGFFLKGGPVGCLLVHGFTGSPLEMRELGEFLQEKGLTVSIPLLPGHGVTPDELNRVCWQDWVARVEEALAELRDQCETLFVAGLSLGALLTLHLAARQPDIRGIALYSPAIRVANRFFWLLPLARHVIKRWPKEPEEQDDLTPPQADSPAQHYDCYPTTGANELRKFQRVVRRELASVRVPAIVFYSTGDRMIHPDAGPFTFDRLGSEDKELVTLHNSGHNLMVDIERESIYARTYGFIVSHLA